MRKGSRMLVCSHGCGGRSDWLWWPFVRMGKKGEVGVKTVWRREGGERERERGREWHRAAREVCSNLWVGGWAFLHHKLVTLVMVCVCVCVCVCVYWISCLVYVTWFLTYAHVCTHTLWGGTGSPMATLLWKENDFCVCVYVPCLVESLSLQVIMQYVSSYDDVICWLA